MKVQKAVNVVISVILWLVIILAAFFTSTTLATRDSNNVSSLGGYTPLIVETDSMAPTFKAGDMIIIKRVSDPSKLKEGDIITFHTIIMNQYALNTHRIESIEEVNGFRSYVTKGDNNAITDSHIISDADIVGKYVARLAGFGKLISFLSTSTGFFVLIVLPMLVFFIYQLYHLIMVSIRLKKAVAEEAANGAAAEITASAEAKAKDAEAKAKEAEEKLAELEKLKAEYEAKLAEAQKNSDTDNNN